MKVTLTSGGGGILSLDVGAERMLLVHIPLSAKPGDTLQLQLADVTTQTPVNACAHKVTYDYPAFGTLATGKIFRVLCVSAPNISNASDTQPHKVHFKCESSEPESYVNNSSTIADAQQPRARRCGPLVPQYLSHQVDMAVLEDQPDLSWLWQEHTQDISIDYE